MLVYYLIYALLGVGAYWYGNRDDRNKYSLNYCVFAFILIASMLALRNPNMGIDLHYGSKYGYLGMYKIIGNSSWNQVMHNSVQNYERGYIVFCKLISYLGDNEQILLSMCSIISIGSVSYIIYKYSSNYNLSFIIYLGLPVFLLNYSGLRQVIAIAITLYSYKFIVEKKKLFFILTIILACTFHSSAIIFIISYPLYYIKSNGTFRFFSIVALPFFYLMRYPLFKVFSRLFKQNITPDYNDAITLFIIFGLIYFFTIIFSNKEDEHESGLKNLFWMACVCQAFGGVYSIAIRVGYYFMIYLMLLIPKVLNNIKATINDGGRTYTIFFIGIDICFILFGLYSLYSTYWSMSYPYYFFWQDYVISI